MAGALGLEYMRGTDRWEEVGAHGHAVVTVLGGAVLDRITGGRYKACRHRVVMVPPPLGAAADTADTADTSASASASADIDTGAFGGRHRIAATFFFRPAPSAKLTPPPCLAQTRLRPDGK